MRARGLGQLRTPPEPVPAQLRPVPGRHTSLVNFMVCRASSRVGERMRARAPVWALRALSRSNMGMRKQAVLPLPVRAMATTSLPSRITGMVWGETSERGVGSSPAPKHHRTQWRVGKPGHLSEWEGACHPALIPSLPKLFAHFWGRAAHYPPLFGTSACRLSQTLPPCLVLLLGTQRNVFLSTKCLRTVITGRR